MHEELEKAFLNERTRFAFMATHALDAPGATFCPQSAVARDGACAVVSYDANAIKVWYLMKGEKVFGTVQYNDPRAVELLIRMVDDCLHHIRGITQRWRDHVKRRSDG